MVQAANYHALRSIAADTSDTSIGICGGAVGTILRGEVASGGVVRPAPVWGSYDQRRFGWPSERPGSLQAYVPTTPSPRRSRHKSSSALGLGLGLGWGWG